MKLASRQVQSRPIKPANRMQVALRPDKPARATLTLSLIVILTWITLAGRTCGAFHLSFGHRLLRSAKQQQPQLLHQQFSNPQLNPARTLIRPIECRNANNHSEAGICMFSIDCMQNKGTPLSICKHNYFVGTCCQLPDYNNFVGIVYDLRDTETLSSQLEARKSFANNTATTTPGDQSSSVNSTTVTATPAPTTTSSTSKPELPNNNLVSNTQAEPLAGAQRPGEQQQQQQQQQLSNRLDEKYVISSASLFGSSPSSMSVASLESARNADGKSPELQLQPDNQINKQQLVDSFQIQLAPASNATISNEILLQNNQPQDGHKEAVGQMRPPANSSAYELIKAEDTALVDQVAEVLSSAHSASGAKGPTYLTTEEQPVAGLQQSVSLSSSLAPTTTTASRLVSSPEASKLASSVQVNGEQEFTMTVRWEPTTSSTTTTTTSTTTTTTSTAATPTLASSTSAPSSTVGSTNSGSSSSSTSGQPADGVAAWSASSPFVDLVSPVEGSNLTSSSSAWSKQEVQTTTPFTSSLSTALLPNISSHPYAPTTQASVALPSQQAHSPLVSSVEAAKQPSSSSTKQQQQQQQLQTSPLPGPSSESLPTFSQLYNNQHSSSSSPSPSSSSTSSNQVLNHPLANHPHRIATMSGGGSSPLSLVLASSPGLQAASKIVSASSVAGSHASNNLIPGLGGLQSAILSHIPLKLASGLSSYLQAAMKPGPGATRPLISSNTAPALQYQHANANSSVGRPAASASGSSVSAVRFPSPSSSSSSSSSTAPTQTPEALNTSSVASPPSPPPRDVVREAQLVCGRPQAMSSNSANDVATQQVAKKRVGRIVGGNQSSFGQWPWMVSLRQWRKGAFLHKCGAALLNENWAITAAHCVENVKASDLLLRLGEFDVSKQDEPYPYMERRVKTLVSHPSFDPKTFEYDLALLRFTEPIQFERNILPVCVPHGNDTYVDRMATVIGWGRLYEDGPLPDIIQHVDVPIITNNECEKMYKNAGYVEEIPDMFICAGINKGGRDSCEGDSGGPLTMVDHDGRSYLVGIISWGIGCALPSQPGVYTRITAFSGWINDIISN